MLWVLIQALALIELSVSVTAMLRARFAMVILIAKLW